MVAPLVASAEIVCSTVAFTPYNITPCFDSSLGYFTTIPTRTFSSGWLSSWKISSGLRSSLPVWTNEDTATSVAGEFINFGLSPCLAYTKKAIATAGGCTCSSADDLTLSKPVFLNVTDGTTVACGIGAARLGVRPVPCNSWLCGCANRVGNDAGAVVSSAYCI